MSVKKGDPVRVRLPSGEVVDAVYDKPAFSLEKCHHVKIGEDFYIALGGKYARRIFFMPNGCRFVGPTPMVKKEQELEKILLTNAKEPTND